GCFAQQLDLYYAEGAGEGADVDDREAEGNAQTVVADNAGERVNNEDVPTDDGVSARNVEAKVIETAPNEANSAVHDAGIDVPLEPAHGLRQNPPVTIEDWPDPKADANDELYDDEPVSGPNCDPEYVEHDLPARFDPIDEPRLADNEICEILQWHLGNLATQQWVDMSGLKHARDAGCPPPHAFLVRYLGRPAAGVFGFSHNWNRLHKTAANIKIRINVLSAMRRDIMHAAIQGDFIVTLPSSRNSQKELARKLGYRVEAERRFDPEVFKDIFDGDNYRMLHQTLLRLDSDYCFFDNPQDLALGILTDGFRIWNRIDNVICVGVIPGPKQCKDLNSFLVPLLEELLALKEGVEMGGFVPGEDAPRNFILHVFLILGFGDIPVVAKMLLIKAHNAVTPCRACIMQAVLCRLSERKSIYYIPLTNPTTMQTLPIDELLMRSHMQTLAIFKKLDQLNVLRKKNKQEELSQATGIVGRPIFAYLKFVDLSSSFPYDIMHLLFENLVPNMIWHWTGKFKWLDQGNGAYELAPGDWEEIGRCTAQATRTIPSAFIGTIPDIAEDGNLFKAEAHSFWIQHMAPILLRG
ncbi:hypothetical protein FRC06_006281, partial [Ceratobasidium sp. 370]